MNLTSQELNLRLQNLKCCIATLSNELLNKIKIGSPDIDCKLRELQILQGYYKYIKCYQVSGKSSTGTIKLNFISAPEILHFFVNGTDISGAFTITNDIESIQTGLIITAINNHQSIYIASLNNLSDTTIDLTSNICINGVLTFTTDYGGKGPPSITLENIICKENLNCLTELEVKKMLDIAATKCKNCFSLTI